MSTPSALRLSQQVAAGVFAIPVPIPYPFRYVNCYLLLGDGAVLVDCALDTPEATAALEAALLEHGLRYADLERLVLTHHHPDHYGLAGLIEREGVGVWMLDVELERGHVFWTREAEMSAANRALFGLHGVPEAALSDIGQNMGRTRRQVHPAHSPKSFADNEVLTLAGQEWRAIWTPGHADGHAMLFREADGVLLAGDQILERISPNVGIWAYSYPDPLGMFLKSLERTRGLGARLALPGHYRPIAAVAGRVDELKAHHAERLEFLTGLMTEPQTAWALSLGLFAGGLNPVQRRFAWSETLAHLEYLVGQGRAIRLEGEVVRFALGG
ncbi:MAG: MBL fold metallo-hydrolase [Meiothermus sp.]|nr:MBL fold metallo-hydrolase [Meiothermus sp.]